MLARVVNAQLKIPQIDAAAETWRRYMDPYKTKGMKDAYLLVDRSNGKMLSVTIWNDSVAHEGYEKSEDRVNGQKDMAAFFEGTGQLSIMDVRVAIK